MDPIIITVVDHFSGRDFDIEVPVDIEIFKLIDDITQTLHGYCPELWWDIADVTLYSRRQRHRLDVNKTLHEEKVWNGDYIDILSSLTA